MDTSLKTQIGSENTVWHTEIHLNRLGRGIVYDAALVHRIITVSTGDPKSVWCSPRPGILLVQTRFPLSAETFSKEASSIRQAQTILNFDTGARVEVSGVVSATKCRERKRIPIKCEDAPKWVSNHLLGCRAEIDSVQNLSPAQGDHCGHRIITCRLAFHGYATVTDQAAFAEVLKNGIGKGKRFGAGLILAKKVI